MPTTEVKPRDANEVFLDWLSSARSAMAAKFEAQLDANVALAVAKHDPQTEWQAYRANTLKSQLADLDKQMNDNRDRLLGILAQAGMEAAMADAEELLDKWRVWAERYAEQEVQRIVGNR